MKPLFLGVLCHMLLSQHLLAGDVLIADFEGENFGEWQVSGDAFGEKPSLLAFPGQSQVTGYIDTSFANSFHGGADAKGVITSPSFVIERDYINFLVGGGAHLGSRKKRAPKNFWGDESGVMLLVDPEGLPYTFDLIHTQHHRIAVGDRVVLRVTTGLGVPSTVALEMRWSSWDVRSLRGRTAQVRIVDNCVADDGYICVDQIAQSDSPRQDLLSNPQIIARANRNVERASEKPVPDAVFISSRPRFPSAITPLSTTRSTITCSTSTTRSGIKKTPGHTTSGSTHDQRVSSIGKTCLCRSGLLETMASSTAPPARSSSTTKVCRECSTRAVAQSAQWTRWQRSATTT